MLGAAWNKLSEQMAKSVAAQGGISYSKGSYDWLASKYLH